MINKIWNWIKNIFKSEKQDPHLVLYEEVEQPKPTHCQGHLRLYFLKQNLIIQWSLFQCNFLFVSLILMHLIQPLF